MIQRENKRRELNCGCATVLLSVGELSPRKNHKVVIKALAEMKEINYQYYIVGQGDLREELEVLISDSGLSGRVHLLGYRSDIAELCNAADIFVFPSLQEGLPVALMEAMASGLPCAASRIRGNTDLIDEGKGGVMFDPNSFDDVRGAIHKLLVSDREKIKKYNFEKIKEFSISSVALKMKRIYEEVEE